MPTALDGRIPFFGDPGTPQPAVSPDDSQPRHRSKADKTLAFAGIAALGIASGSAIAAAGLNALYLCVSLIGCAFVLYDFRIGVVVLILLMPISSSYVFPH